MIKKERINSKRVNFYDGHRVTERDLDTEQVNNNALASNLVLDFHGSGILKSSPFDQKVLLDTRSPGKYGDNFSEVEIATGNYDGKPIYLDVQPSDATYGNRIELELYESNAMGRLRTKVMIIGRAFDGANAQGELVAEFVEFYGNEKRVSSKFYTSIIAVIFNHFSGGLGRTEVLSSVESENLIGDAGYMIIRESPQMSVYPATKVAYQTESPNYDLNNFISSDPSRGILYEIELALGSANNINDMYIELDGREEKIRFEKLGATSISYGQKFLATTNNLQRVDLLLSVRADSDLPYSERFDFSGNLVVGIHKLATGISSPTDPVPNDLIDYDPEITPIVEVSFGQEDLEALGYKLTSDPQIVSFNFAGTLIADPNLDPSIEKGKYYAILVSRRGDNRKGTITLGKGYDKVSKKIDDGVPQTTLEQFGKQQSKYVEYDPITKKFVNDSTSSLWYQVHSDTVEITDGTAYTDSGVAVTIPKVAEFVGNTKISYFEKDIALRTVSEGASNYLILSQKESFSEAGVHPRTNNFVFTRIADVPSISMVNQSELNDIIEDSAPVIISKIEDGNVRSASKISGTFSKPGLIGINTVRLLDPSNDILYSNLINRVIIPDTACSCNATYRIVRVECSIEKLGDLNSDGQIKSEDLSLMMPIVGNTINSKVTERKIFNDEIDIIDFIKSDLNEDGTIDGIDIEFMENAIDGYVNFSATKEFRVITLHLENVLSESDYPRIFKDTAGSGLATAGTATLTIDTSKREALIIRSGDRLSIPSTDVNAGEYIISSKSIANNEQTLTLTVTDLDGVEPSFSSSSGFDVTITSGSRVNLYADNKALVDTPFESYNYEINFIESPFQDNFLNICDLKRYVGTSFIEEKVDPCICEESSCAPPLDCAPVYKNQTYVPGDLYLPSGNILTAPGVPHPGDYEYTNIKVPLPPGSITGCSIDLYNTFVKSKNGTCFTAAGYPAMKYSDGTLVGCEDSGLNNDIAKGRVKFSSSISGVCVDALVDGYIVDGYSEGYINQFTPGPTSIESITNAVEVISERYNDFSYDAFDTWTLDPISSPSFTISNLAGPNTPATFDLTTNLTVSNIYGRLNCPVEMEDLENNFIIDFKMSRDAWPTEPTLSTASNLTQGVVSSFATFVITNSDSTVSTLKLGWKMTGGYKTKIFYSGSVKSGLAEFDYEINAPDEVLDVVYFRLRRIDDVVYAYYIIPTKIDSVTAESFGQYVRIGSNPSIQPGDGTVNMSVELSQENSPNVGILVSTSLHEVIARSNHVIIGESTEYLLRRNPVSKLTNRLTFTMPFELTRKTTVISADLILTPSGLAADAPTSLDSINIIPFTLINADNIGTIFNIPTEDDVSYMVNYNLDGFTTSNPITISMTSVYNALLQKSGHLPGFLKGFIIEPDGSSDFSFEVLSSITFEIVYLENTTGIVFKIGVDLNPATGIATLNTKNILYDALNKANRTVLNFGVYLKKSGFRNNDIEISIDDLSRLGIGVCNDTEELPTETDCYFITGSTEVGTFVEGPFPCPL